MNRILQILVVLLCGLYANTVVAQSPDLRIIAVDGLFAVSDEQVKQIYADASKYFKQVGITFRMTFQRIDYNPCIYKHSLLGREDELKCFRFLTTRRAKIITYVMTPPFITVNNPYGPQTAWIAGVAFLCGNLSTGNALERSVKDGVIGEDRLPHSATILAHEVFHNMCAKHNDSRVNLMHSTANQFTTQYHGNLPVLESTKRQVKRWYVKRRKM